MPEVIKSGIYRDENGVAVHVFGQARHSETGEKHLVHRSLLRELNDKEEHIWQYSPLKDLEGLIYAGDVISESLAEPPSLIEPGIYEHYKHAKHGDKYWAVFSAINLDNPEEQVVVYKPLYVADYIDPKEWVIRPLEMFTEFVEVRGIMIPRFKFMGPVTPEYLSAIA